MEQDGTISVMQVDYSHQDDPFPEQNETEEETVGGTEQTPNVDETDKKPTTEETTTEETTAEETTAEETTTEEPTTEDDETEEDETEEKAEAEEVDPKDEETTLEGFDSIVQALQPIVGDEVEFKTVDDINTAVTELVETNKSLQQTNKDYMEDNEKIRVMFQKNPDIASMIESLASGDNPFYSLGFIQDIIDNATTEEMEEYERGNKARNERLQKERETFKHYEQLSSQIEQEKKEFDKNLKESDKAVRVWAKENGVTEERADEEIKLAQKLFSEKIFKGKIDGDVMDIIHTYVNKENLINDALEAGRINAKNDKIVSKKLELKTKSDGLPSNSSTNDAPHTHKFTEAEELERILGYKPSIL